jgi:dipeptidyl-peptidase-4
MFVLPLLLAAAAPLPSPSPAPPASLSLERVFADPPLDGRRPLQAQVSPGGHWVSFLKPSVADSEVLELWGQPLPAGEPRKLVSSTDLLAGKAQKLTEAERMALERKRISQRGITSYSWCGDDDGALLFPLSGDLYVARLTDHGPEATRLTTDDDVPEENPACDAAGARVAYVKNGDVVVRDLKTNKARALTTSALSKSALSKSALSKSAPTKAPAAKTKFFGQAVFIASEELGRFDGFWWSHDGKRLLVLGVDESGVGEKTRAQIFADRTELVSQRYPAAGEKNAVVTAQVIDATTGKTTPVPLPDDAEYVARGGFFVDGHAWLQILTRDQKKLTLLAVDATTGKSRVVVDERDDAWVEVHDDLGELKGVPLSGKPALLWSSESSGRKQLVVVDRVNGARTPLTTMDEPVEDVVCTDGRRVVFTAARERGRAADLFVVDAVDPAHPTTRLAGSREHATRTGIGDRGCQHLLTTTSTWGQPPVSSNWPGAKPTAAARFLSFSGAEGSVRRKCVIPRMKSWWNFQMRARVGQLPSG